MQEIHHFYYYSSLHAFSLVFKVCFKLFAKDGANNEINTVPLHRYIHDPLKMCFEQRLPVQNTLLLLPLLPPALHSKSMYRTDAQRERAVCISLGTVRDTRTPRNIIEGFDASQHFQFSLVHSRRVVKMLE